MDRFDEELLELVDSGTTRYSALAKRMAAPLSTVHARMKRLEKDGVIRGYKGDIDWARAGLPLMAFILISIDVNLLHGMKKTQERLLGELLGLQYVKEGHIITGEADMLVKVIAKDSSHLKDILLNHIDSVSGVVRTRTIVVLG